MEEVQGHSWLASGFCLGSSSIVQQVIRSQYCRSRVLVDTQGDVYQPAIISVRGKQGLP